jgi:MFS family permease
MAPLTFAPQAFLSLGLGLGIGLGTIFIPSVAVVSQWFNRRRAFAMGVMSSGVALGSMVHPIMLNNLIHGRVGFANGVRASAGLVAGCLIIAALLMRTRLPPRKQPPVRRTAKKFANDIPYVLIVIR